MGCICSKGTSTNDVANEKQREKKELSTSSVQLVASSRKGDVVIEVGGGGSGSVRPVSRQALPPTLNGSKDAEKNTIIVERPTNARHQRRATMDIGPKGGQALPLSRLVSMPDGAQGEQIVSGWPSWLTSVAGEAIQGWVPRRADSFEKLDKIGQGTYSSVYKARDLETGKIVAMKKVRFVNMDPESVRFMAREICILRKLDHPNVMKLEGLVTSRMSGSLYLVFEYMEHDLAGLAATPGIKFTEPQIKCYIRQLLLGLEHCHSRGVLHRDIKGSNLLINNNGVLKIGDFGLANIFHPDKKQPLTSRVVTLWYRAPELLLGATEYGVGVDMWSVGCILAELFSGKPIMPGTTEVEQMHKIFKLCGSPSEEYFRKSKLPHATIFKPHHPYKRCVAETLKDFPSSASNLIDVLLSIEPEARGSAASALNSEFITTKPFPCDPSSLPKYPPSKEFDAKRRDEEAKRKTESLKGRGPQSVRTDSRQSRPTPEFNPHGQSSNPKSSSQKHNPNEDGGSGFPIEPPRGPARNGFHHSSSMIHPSAYGSSRNKKVEGSVSRVGSSRAFGSSTNGTDMRTKRSQLPQPAPYSSTASQGKEETFYSKESIAGYVQKKNRIHYSGPLMPPGGNIEDMLKEHERQIQEAVRKARLVKTRTKKNYEDHQSEFLHHHRVNG